MLIGHEDDQAVIERLLDGVRARRSATLLVLGEPGIGTSACFLASVR
jgi:hypothetical protein